MSDFINGIGFTDDLKPLELTDDGYPIIKPGFVYSENIEYYVFASGLVVPLLTEETVDLDYYPGSPYFIVNRLVDVKNDDGFYYVNTIDALAVVDPSYVNWEYDGETWSFHQSGFTGKYLVFDTANQMQVNKRIVEPSYLVLSDIESGEPYEISIEAVLLSSVVTGEPLKFLARVADSNGVLLENKLVQWYKVYETAASGILTDDIMASTTTDENGVTDVSMYVTSSESDVCIYAKYGNLKSNLHWIQVNSSLESLLNVFQFDDEEVLLAPQEVLTAVGYDAWGYLWSSGTLTTGYDGIVTGQPEHEPYSPTRGDWKEDNIHLKRPPVTIINYDGVTPFIHSIEPIANEISGVWNIEDFGSEYTMTEAELDAFILAQRVAVQGYWGQVIVSGDDIRNIAGLDTNCLNKTDTKYTIYHLDSDGDINIWGYDDDQIGITGSWNDVHEELTTKYDSLYYVLYCPGYKGVDATYFRTHNFYFRGLALMNTDDTSDDYLSQDYAVTNLFTQKPLQGY